MLFTKYNKEDKTKEVCVGFKVLTDVTTKTSLF